MNQPKIARFHVRTRCSCGAEREVESMLGGPGGIAPLSCACGRKFALVEYDPSEVASLEVRFGRR